MNNGGLATRPSYIYGTDNPYAGLSEQEARKKFHGRVARVTLTVAGTIAVAFITLKIAKTLKRAMVAFKAPPKMNKGDESMTFRVGYMPKGTTYSKLITVFGEPGYKGEWGDKVNVMWIGTIDKKVFTIYDYKSTTPVENNTVWNIGGRDPEVANKVLNYFNTEKGDKVEFSASAPKPWDGKGVQADFPKETHYSNVLNLQRTKNGPWKEIKRWSFYDESGVTHIYQNRWFNIDGKSTELKFDEKLWFPKDPEFDKDRIFAMNEYIGPYEGMAYNVYIPTSRFSITELGDEINESGRKVYSYPRWEFVKKDDPDFHFILRGEPKVLTPESNIEIADAFDKLIKDLGGYERQEGTWSITTDAIVENVKENSNKIHEDLNECIKVLPGKYTEELVVRAK